MMLGVSEKIQKTFKQKHYATFILHVHKCSYNIVTTSNVYSNFFIARRGRKVSATEGCYSHAGWSPQEHTAQRRAELLTRGGGGRAAAGTCRRAHLRGAWGPRLAARLLIYLPGEGGVAQQKRLLQDCLGHGPPSHHKQGLLRKNSYSTSTVSSYNVIKLNSSPNLMPAFYLLRWFLSINMDPCLFALHASIRVRSLWNTSANRAWTSQHLLSAPGYAANGVSFTTECFRNLFRSQESKDSLKTTSAKSRTSGKTA